MKTIRKESAETVAIIFDWRDRLEMDESILTSTYTLESGITSASNRILNRATEVYVSGGTLGTTYTVENQITTNRSNGQGQTMNRTYKVQVVSR